jgi:hypothetical protein
MENRIQINGVWCHEGVETFISFLKILKNKGWL